MLLVILLLNVRYLKYSQLRVLQVCVYRTDEYSQQFCNMLKCVTHVDVSVYISGILIRSCSIDQQDTHVIIFRIDIRNVDRFDVFVLTVDKIVMLFEYLLMQ
jgi:hypothetical protein